MLQLCYILGFLLFINVQAKELIIDLEADFPDKSSVHIEYIDKVNYFSPGEFQSGVEKPHICNVVVFSNVKQHIELKLFSKEGNNEEFLFYNSDKTNKIAFHLFKSNDKEPIENGGILMSEYSSIEPLSKVIPLGLRLPQLLKTTETAGMFSTRFTIMLNHTG